MCIRDRAHPLPRLDLGDGALSEGLRIAAALEGAQQPRKAKGGVGLGPVSYTHLDVYKRQGITSPDGRVFGRMAHAERTGAQLYRNVPGNQDSGIFRGAVDYFRD